MPDLSLERAVRVGRRLLRRFAAGRPDAVQPSFPTAHLIDTVWCDIHGVHVQGWAHAFERPVRRLVFHCGGQTVAFSEFSDRPDLLPHFPAHPHVVHTGFSLYLPFPPFRPVRIEVVTDTGSAFLDLDVPEHLRGEPPAGQEPPMGRFIAEMQERGGTVLEIGARVVGDMTASMAALLGPRCKHIGFDIHAAPGVDVVGDAHALSRYVAPGSIDGIMSVAVLEHLQTPWLAAAEINRVLKPGGLTLHVVPQSWPVHEMPNDFWRMSDEGLKVLFGPALGFEVVEAGMSEPFTVIPRQRIGSWATMPLCPAFGGSHILARKVAEIPDDAVVWPTGSGALAERAKHYPKHDGGAPA